MKSVLLRTTGIAMAAGLLAASGNAMAQDAAAGGPDASNLEDSDVIIVTANRRAQDVQDVQIAVTAVDAVTLERQGVDNIVEVTDVAPSFSSSTAQVASGSVVLRIRGVGTTSNNIGFESAVGIFVDGAYQSRPGVALSEFVDVERLEVLRGPQGTLFGRNTSAGALSITNKRPDLNDFGGFANASYGNFDQISLQGAVNVPIVQDSVAVRLTGAFRKRDGFLTVVDAAGNAFDDTNDVEQYIVRGQIGFETEGGIKGRLIADYSNSTSSCCGAIELFESPVIAAGAYAAVGLPRNGGNGQDFVSRNRFGQAEFERAADNRQVSLNFAPEADVDNYGVTGEVELPLSDNADLIFIGSYRKYDALERYDSDFTALDIFNVDPLLTEIETYTAELRLQGDAADGRLNYMVGGYYSDEQINTQVTFLLGQDYGENVGAAFFGGAFGPNPLTSFTGVDPAGTVTTNAFNQSAQSYSVFTHNSFEIAEGLEITLGARYSWEDKEGGFDQIATNNQICPASAAGILNGSIPGAFVPAFVGLGCFGFAAPADLPASAVLPLVRTFDANFNDEELIYTAKIGYAFAAPVNVYASFTHGYKSGGINLDTTAAVAGADPTFKSEEVDAYEIGLKAKLLDNRVTLNLAGFREEFSNFQVLEFTGTAFQTFNVPKAISTGVELETVIRPSDELSINGGLTVLDARYPDDCSGDSLLITVNSLCGNDLTNAPNIVAVLGATYEKNFSADWDFFLAGQVRMESDQRTSTQAIVPPTAAQVTALGLQGAIDAAPLIVADVQDGSIFANVRAGFGRADDSLAIEFWVNNLTDRVTRGVTFNTTLRSTGANNSRSAFTLQPRTYGVTVRTKF
ncbi:TonB-dependent receptor [Altererythrobacter aquiaggeris]|uniref:TonB-dependent receptor n=1 Tax=Aestuarierythrobacter aquiaggeris TaxID=1898396 RepID=UPI00301B6845